VLKEYPDGFFDMVLTSPPYDNLRDYEGYTFEFEPLAHELYRVLKDGGVCVWIVGSSHKDFQESLTPYKQAIAFSEVIGFNLLDTMIYHRNTPTWNESMKTYKQYFEFCFIFSKGKPRTFHPLRDIPTRQKAVRSVVKRRIDGNRKVEYLKPNENGARGNVWWYDTGFMKSTKDTCAFDHPATFPEKLAEDHILSWSNPGDIVLDPMCGSGTTCKMAVKHGRQYVGIDCSEKYCEISRKRIEKFTAQRSRNSVKNLEKTLTNFLESLL